VNGGSDTRLKVPFNFLHLSCGHSSSSAYLPSAGLVLDVVGGADLGAHVLEVGRGRVDGPGGPRGAGHRRLLLHGGLLGHGGLGEDAAAVGGLAVNGGGGGGDGGLAGAGCRGIRDRKEVRGGGRKGPSGLGSHP